jgi:tripartite-type tricarboxylate transporter receptor subunit TctC
MELFKQQSGIDITHVAYKGGSPMQAAVLGGEIQLGCFTIPAALAQIKAGRMRPLAVTGAARSAVLPQVPTVAESGYAGAEVATTFGLFAPAGTPKDVIATLNSRVREVVNMADIRERFAAQGVSASASTPEGLGDILNAEIVKWAKIIKAANIRVE